MNCPCGNEIEPARVARLATKGKVAKFCEGCNKRKLRALQRNERRWERHELLSSMGLQRVRGNLGGVYYE